MPGVHHSLGNTTRIEFLHLIIIGQFITSIWYPNNEILLLSCSFFLHASCFKNNALHHLKHAKILKKFMLVFIFQPSIHLATLFKLTDW